MSRHEREIGKEVAGWSAAVGEEEGQAKMEKQTGPVRGRVGEVVPLLRSDPEGELSATTILEWLDERHPGRFGNSQLRTLQRRIRDYRALHGPRQGRCTSSRNIRPVGRHRWTSHTARGLG